MINNYTLRSLTIFSFLIYLILASTNKYYSVEEAAIIGFSDGMQYFKIIQASPGIPIENVASQQAYRFILPYTIGALSHFTQVNDYYLLILFIFIIHLLILNVFNHLIIHIGSKKNFSLIIICTLIFNAYFFRPALLTPYLINDWIFIYGLLLITSYVLKKKEHYFYIGLILCAISRQTSLILNILFICFLIFNFNSNKKINKKIYMYGIIINSIIFVLLSIISSVLFTNFDSEMYSNLMLGIFYLNYSFLELAMFTIRFINTNLFIIILLIFFVLNFKTNRKILNFEILFLLFLGIILWVQPILGGPSFTGGNIPRLTITSMPIILVLYLFIFKDVEVEFIHTVTIIFLLFISSFHHNYTYFFNYFLDYKNFHFAGINFFIHFVIFIILFNNNRLYKKS